MEAYLFCQSCGMPLDRPEDLGTEKDGSKSTIYCIHCYRNGDFSDDAMTLQVMGEHVKAQLAAIHADEKTVHEALGRLRYLSRWLGIPAIHHHRNRH